MISPIQNCSYTQNFTGSIKINPAIRAVEKHLQKDSVEQISSGALEFYNFLQKILNDGTKNKLVVTTYKRPLEQPVHMYLENNGSVLKSRIFNNWLITRVRYGNIVREYDSTLINDLKPNLGMTIKSNLIEFGKELFGEEELKKASPRKLRRSISLGRKYATFREEIDGIMQRIEQKSQEVPKIFNQMERMVEQAGSNLAVSQLEANTLMKNFYESNYSYNEYELLFDVVKEKLSKASNILDKQIKLLTSANKELTDLSLELLK